MADKTKSQTYNFLSENKSIEDIKNQSNIYVKEKRRHNGVAYKFIDKNNTNDQQINDDLFENINENLEPITSNLTNEVKEQETNKDIWTKLKNYLNWTTLSSISNIEEISKLQTIIQEQATEIQQLKKENEKIKQKQSNVNLKKYKYNAVTIYDEKQRKNTGIKKIHEEILPIKDKIIFITTFVNIDNSITEEVIYFQELINGDIQFVQQIKNYKNINEYKKDILLIEDTSKHNNCQFLPIKDFLKKQQNFKLKPTATEKWIWCIFTVVTLLIVTSTLLLLVPPIASISAIAIAIKTTAGIMAGTRIFASLFSSATRKVDVWFGNKFHKSTEQKEKEKKERQSIIKNLTNDKLETQYDILKQKLNTRKEEIPKKLINHNSNSFKENSSAEQLNPNNFDSSIRNTVNKQEQLPSTSSNKNWNKVKCLLT